MKKHKSISTLINMMVVSLFLSGCFHSSTDDDSSTPTEEKYKASIDSVELNSRNTDNMGKIEVSLSSLTNLALASDRQTFEIHLSDTGGYQFSPSSCKISLLHPCSFTIDGKNNENSDHTVSILTKESDIVTDTPILLHALPNEAFPVAITPEYILMQSSNILYLADYNLTSEDTIINKINMPNDATKISHIYTSKAGNTIITYENTAKLILVNKNGDFKIINSPEKTDEVANVYMSENARAIIQYNNLSTVKLVDQKDNSADIKAPNKTAKIKEITYTQNGQFVISYTNTPNATLIKATNEINTITPPENSHYLSDLLNSANRNQIAIVYDSNLIQLIKSDGSLLTINLNEINDAIGSKDYKIDKFYLKSIFISKNNNINIQYKTNLGEDILNNFIIYTADKEIINPCFSQCSFEHIIYSENKIVIIYGTQIITIDNEGNRQPYKYPKGFYSFDFLSAIVTDNGSVLIQFKNTNDTLLLKNDGSKTIINPIINHNILNIYTTGNSNFIITYESTPISQMLDKDYKSTTLPSPDNAKSITNIISDSDGDFAIAYSGTEVDYVVNKNKRIIQL
ncbi:hypothetical protein L3V83_10500 [Thiotrichales bacterium 19X7-9]|nr:hypothetical protein [Thiotrichales bacterium 19X7-9]